MKINFVGDIFGSTGFSSHCRQLANATYKLNKETSIEQPGVPQNWESLVTNDEKAMIEGDYRRNVNVMITNPLSWTLKAADKPELTIGFGIHEGSRIPTAYIEAANKVDAIVVPSQHVYDAFKPFTTKPMEIVPHGVDSKIFYPKKLEEISKEIKQFID